MAQTEGLDDTTKKRTGKRVANLSSNYAPGSIVSAAPFASRLAF